MSNELYKFLENLNINPDQLNAFVQDPNTLLDTSELPPEAKEALKKGDLQKILELLGPPPTSLVTWVTVPVFTFVDSSSPLPHP